MSFIGKLVVVDGVRVHEDYETDGMPVESIGDAAYWSLRRKRERKLGIGMSHEDIEAQRKRKGYGEYSNRYMPLSSTADRPERA